MRITKNSNLREQHKLVGHDFCGNANIWSRQVQMRPLSEIQENQSLHNENENQDQNTKFLISDGTGRLRDSQSSHSVPLVYI